VLVEPPDSHVSGRRPSRRQVAEAVAAATATLLAVAGVGDAFLVAGLLIVVGRDAAPVLAVTATLVRWGRSGLPAITGAQAVLGPAVAVGPALYAASTWTAAAALVAAAPPGWRAIPFGALAGVLACGGDPPLRLLGIVTGAGAAVATSRFLPRRWAPLVALGLGLAAVVLAMVARATA
jgi:hypothetical protein